MTEPGLTRVFLLLRLGLHGLFFALLVLVAVRVGVTDGPHEWRALSLTALLGCIYAAGMVMKYLPNAARRPARLLWLAMLSSTWIALVVLVPDATYLVFPLFFLYLHLLPWKFGAVAVAGATSVAVVVLGFSTGFTVGGVVGPLVGAGVALLIGLGYAALARDAAERERLLTELLATRDRLAASEREQGVLAERARLAREIHDTVAQSLSSIQMLLYAAEEMDPAHAGADHVRLARETAAASLAETRRFIRELAPPGLDDGLEHALLRLAEQAWAADGLRVSVEAPQPLTAPMDVQTALLRIAQGTLANVIKHASATHATIRVAITSDEVSLHVSDDGIGFDPQGLEPRSLASDSFGLRAIAERVDQLGGQFEVASAPGAGTTVTVRVGLE